MPRYVILLHEMPPGAAKATHWDFMLVDGGALLTWALAGELAPGTVVSAEQLADHRLAYLDYEGPVSGDRGAVTQWDAGEFAWLERSAETISVSLHGHRCRGVVELKRDADDGSAGGVQRWSVSLRKI